VTIFRVADNEHVVSAARIEESEEEAEAVLTDGTDEASAPADAEPVQVEDGTGPHTNSQSIPDEDDEPGEPD
jgi:DNA gyrase subunit A